MSLTIGEIIKVILKRRNMTVADLAKKIGENGQSRQNLTNKFARDNFSEKEVRELANALNCDIDIIFTMRDTGDKIKG